MIKQHSLLFISTTLLLSACAQEKLDSENKQQEDLVVKEQKQKNNSTQQIQQHEVELHRTVLGDNKKNHNRASPIKMMRKEQSQAGLSIMHIAAAQPIYSDRVVDNEKYKQIDANPTFQVSQQPVSTFSIDVDTASYANVRRLLNQGSLPQHSAVRVEELINYFSYDYGHQSFDEEQSFSIYSEVGPSPYNRDKQLIHIGIQGKDIAQEKRPASNLVFLIDVSGSMNNANKIGLLKSALKMLTNQLNEQDKVAIVVYAGAAGTVLEPTAGDNNQAIIDALSRLSAGGSTNGGAGIEAAYALARASFIKDGINRVILATDGDFNVGTTNQQVLKELIIKQRESGVALSILGFGAGNYNDALMQELAQNGDGNAYYIDTLNEARKVLVEELSSTLMIIAKDVKIQVEFNPNLVSEYRLIGYETRALKRQDFNNDKVDAGDIGAGHTVTALYEVSLVGGKNQSLDPLRYGSNLHGEYNNESKSNSKVGELAYLRLRYKKVGEDKSRLIEQPIILSNMKSSLEETSNNFKFSAAVAGFGQLLTGGENLSTMTISQIITLAQQSKGEDQHGYRGEFINMVKLADALAPKRVNNKSSIAKY